MCQQSRSKKRSRKKGKSREEVISSSQSPTFASKEEDKFLREVQRTCSCCLSFCARCFRRAFTCLLCSRKKLLAVILLSLSFAFARAQEERRKDQREEENERILLLSAMTAKNLFVFCF